MIARDAQPINHIPPLKPIELRPVYPHAQTEPKSFWEMQYDESIKAELTARHERMWAAVVEFAQGRGSLPLNGHFPQRGSGADALNESEAISVEIFDDASIQRLQEVFAEYAAEADTLEAELADIMVGA